MVGLLNPGRVAVAVLVLILAAVLLLLGSGNSASAVCLQGDLDGDGWPEEYCLADRVLSVRERDRELWKSSPDWCVDSFSLGDADNDGTTNLVFTLWKEGSFGEVRPFWHTGEDDDYKNHLFVYKLQEDTFKPVWCSSNLDRPILSFEIRDANNDSLNELVVREGQYRKLAGARYIADSKGSVQTTVWQWEEWGFSCATDLMVSAAEL